APHRDGAAEIDQARVGAVDVRDRKRSRWLCRQAAGGGQQGRRRGVRRGLADAGMRGFAAGGAASHLYGGCGGAAMARACLGPVQPGHITSARPGRSTSRSLAITIALAQPNTESDSDTKSDTKSDTPSDTRALSEPRR